MDYTRCSDANEITARYMDSILIEERLIDSTVADVFKALALGADAAAVGRSSSTGFDKPANIDDSVLRFLG